MLHLNLRKIRLTISAVQSDSISSYADNIENCQALEKSIVKKCTEYIGGKICIVPVCLKKRLIWLSATHWFQNIVNISWLRHMNGWGIIFYNKYVNNAHDSHREACFATIVLKRKTANVIKIAPLIAIVINCGYVIAKFAPRNNTFCVNVVNWVVVQYSLMFCATWGILLRGEFAPENINVTT